MRKYKICTKVPSKACAFHLLRKKTYFRASPRAVAASIDQKLRPDVVHHAADALNKFRDFRRSAKRFSDPSTT